MFYLLISGLSLYLTNKLAQNFIFHPKKDKTGSNEAKNLAEANEELKSKLALLELVEKEYEVQTQKTKELADKLSESEKDNNEAQSRIAALENDLRFIFLNNFIETLSF